MRRHQVAVLLCVVVTSPVSLRAAESPSKQDNPLAALSEFTSKYHEKPNPDAVEEHLKTLLADDVLKKLDPLVLELVAHSFGHMGRGNVKLVRIYETQFANAGAAGKIMLLRILRVCGDADTVTEIEKWESTATSKQLKKEVASARQFLKAPNRALPRDQAAKAPHDLDLLWADFLVTGDYAPVSRILDVIDGPDELRMAIETYLKKNPGEKERELCFTRLAELDLLQPGTKDDLVPGNLEQRFDRKTLPKVVRFAREVLGEPVEKLYSGILFRASAIWSVQSNLQQHPLLAVLLKENENRRPAASQAVVKRLLMTERAP